MKGIPYSLNTKSDYLNAFDYALRHPEYKNEVIARLERLRKSTFFMALKDDAGLVKIVYSSNCSSLPIASGINFKRMKLLFADTGLYLSASGLDVSQFALETDFKELNIGNVCELSVGLELVNALDDHVKPEIFS